MLPKGFTFPRGEDRKQAMVEFNLFSLFGVSIHFHVHWPNKATGPQPEPAADVVVNPRLVYKHPVTGALIPMRNPPQHLIEEALRIMNEHLPQLPRR